MRKFHMSSSLASVSSSSGRTPVQLMLTRLHHFPFSLDAMHQRYRGYSDHSFVAPQPTAFACPSNFQSVSTRESQSYHHLLHHECALPYAGVHLVQVPVHVDAALFGSIRRRRELCWLLGRRWRQGACYEGWGVQRWKQVEERVNADPSAAAASSDRSTYSPETQE